MKKTAFCLPGLLLAAFAAQAVTAQTAFPTKPITLIVPAASGGPIVKAIWRP